MKDALFFTKFSAVRSSSKFCTCDACYGTGVVTKIHYPMAIWKSSGMVIKSLELWLCDECLQKLKDALVDPAPEK